MNSFWGLTLDINLDTLLQFGLWLILSLIVIDWWHKRAWPFFHLVFGEGLLNIIRAQISDITEDDLIFLAFNLVRYYGITPYRKKDYLRVSRVFDDGELSTYFSNVGDKCPTLEVFIELTNPETNNSFMIGFGYGDDYYDLDSSEREPSE